MDGKTLGLDKLAPTVSGLCLNIGSGDHRMEGYINIDKFNENADVNWDAGRLPLNNCTVAIIQCHQTIEHFGHHEVLSICKEWYRVCKPSGTVHITTPDILSSFKMALDNPSEWNLTRIFGNQSHEGQQHKWGFDGTEITTLFSSAGFTSVETELYTSSDGSTYLYLKATR